MIFFYSLPIGLVLPEHSFQSIHRFVVVMLCVESFLKDEKQCKLIAVISEVN